MVQHGLAESLAPANIEISTKVYKHPDHPNEDYFKSSGDKENAIYPIRDGRIVNLAAFNYFM
jgi:actin-related protein 9